MGEWVYHMPKFNPQGPEGTIWFGGAPDHVEVCLRICGDDLEPDTVSLTLGCQPSRSQRQGQPVLSSDGQVKRIARTGSWILDHPVDEETTINEAIRSFLLKLPDDQSLWTTLASQFTVDLICDLTVRSINRGFELTPDLWHL
jgi:hypothetical protein